MPKRKSGGVLLPWLSARPDNKEGRFVQAGNSLFLSKEFQKLSAGARCLYLCMTLEAGGRREFEFPRASASKFGFSGSSFLRYCKELEEEGFIQTTVCGKCTRTPNRYRFLFEWKGVTTPSASPK